MILEELHQVTDVQSLGLNLGLCLSAIFKILDEYKSLEQQKARIIWLWLQRKDIIPDKQSCLPTWCELVNAVSKDSAVLSQKIESKHCEKSAAQLD